MKKIFFLLFVVFFKMYFDFNVTMWDTLVFILVF